jgi:enoyl-CoA hydratase
VSTVDVEQVAPHVCIIRLNRPERRNAMSFELVGDLHDALDAVAADNDCKVAVLTGAGKGFCAGLDLKDWGHVPAPGEHRHMRTGMGGQEFIAALVTHMRATPQIIVAAVHGAAFGGGLALACAADVRIAARSARFCSAFIRTGLSGTDIGISYLLPRLVGVSRGFDLIISGREIDGEEADRIGLVSQVVDDDLMLDAALAYASTVAVYTPTGLTLTKEVLWHNVEVTSMAAAIALENRNQNLAGQAADVREFMAAYTQRIVGPRSEGANL